MTSCCPERMCREGNVQLMNDLMDLQERVVDLWAQYSWQLQYESIPFVPTDEAIDGIRHRIGALQARALAVRAGGHGEIERVLLHHLIDLLNAADMCVRSDRTFPHRHIATLMDRIVSIVQLDTRDYETRDHILRAILEEAPDVIRGAGDLAALIPAYRRKLALNVLEALPVTVAQLGDVLRESFPYANDAHLNLLDNKLSQLVKAADEVRRGLLDADPPSAVRRGPSYRDILAELYGVDVDRAARDARGAVDQCAEDMHDEARRVDPNRDAFRILREDVPPCNDQREMLSRLKEGLEVARQEAGKYLTLPDGEECEARGVPEHLAVSHTWAGYLAPGLGGSLRGAVFLNHQHYRSMSRGWIQLSAIHHGYPGCHTHYVRSSVADMPTSFKVGMPVSSVPPGAPLTEAISQRSVDLLTPAIGHRVFRLLVAYRKLCWAVQMSCDIMLHFDGVEPGAVVRQYRERLQSSDRAAREQLAVLQMSPGYHAARHCNLRVLERLQAESGCCDASFTSLILSCGGVSTAVLQEILGMRAEERRLMLRQFSTFGGRESCPEE